MQFSCRGSKPSKCFLWKSEKKFKNWKFMIASEVKLCVLKIPSTCRSVSRRFLWAQKYLSSLVNLQNQSEMSMPLSSDQSRLTCTWAARSASPSAWAGWSWTWSRCCRSRAPWTAPPAPAPASPHRAHTSAGDTGHWYNHLLCSAPELFNEI